MLSWRIVSTMLCFLILRVAYHMVAKMRRNTPNTAPRYCIQGRVKGKAKLLENMRYIR